MKIKKSYTILLIFTLIISTIHIKCGEVIEALFNGVVSGTVGAGSGIASGGDASVTQSVGKTDDGSLIIIDSTRTDANGNYSFSNVTIGEKIFTYRLGVFEKVITINIQSDRLYQNIDANLQLDSNIKLAYLFGERDNIQAIVQQMGYPITQLQVSSFNSLSTLLQYRYIFINSGNDSRFNLNTPQISANISDYLEQGGMLYVSDWGVECLRPLYDLPGTYSGNTQTISSAPVTDNGLIEYTGFNSAQVSYQLNNWYSLDSTVECKCVTPYIKGNYSITQKDTTHTVIDRPLAFYHDVGTNGGKFIYTTFRNESTITANVRKILQFYVFQLD